MTKQEAINNAIAAGVLSNDNIVAFDFAGSYRTHEIKEGEITFQHIVDGRLLHWILVA